MELAKGEGIAVMLVGHVTKDGSIAGPKTLEHLVDAVLELGGERSGTLRLLRASKNRFGSTEEIGVFELGEHGLVEVADPARAFLVDHAGPASGSVVAATMEGSRPLLVEVQALVSPAGYGTPARRASGVDANRLALIVAVLGRRAGVSLGTQDIYANLAGGLEVAEPALDLPARDRPGQLVPRSTGAAGIRGRGRGRAPRRASRGARGRAAASGGRSPGFGHAIVPSTRGSHRRAHSGHRGHRGRDGPGGHRGRARRAGRTVMPAGEMQDDRLVGGRSVRAEAGAGPSGGEFGC